MKEKIQEFYICGSKWKMIFKDKVEGENSEWVYGSTRDATKTIQISLKDPEGKMLPKEEVRYTVFHELFHAIFATGQYWNSFQDEPLVEWTGRAIASLIDQKIIK